MRPAVDGQGPSDHGGIASQPRPPEAIAQHDDVSIPRLDRPPHRQRHPDNPEEVVRDAHRLEPIGLVARAPVRVGFLVAAREAVEDAGIAQEAVVPHVGVAVAADAHRRQRLRVKARRLAEQELHRQAEDRGVRTDPEREREHRGRRETGGSPQGARRVRQVGERLLEPPEMPGRPRLFPDAQGRAELATSARQRVLARHPVLLQLVRAHLDVERHLVVELAVEARGAAELGETPPERRHPIREPARHAVRITRWMAITSFSNLFVSRSSCLRPSGVSL
jgi:hypothetical protein